MLWGQCRNSANSLAHRLLSGIATTGLAKATGEALTVLLGSSELGNLRDPLSEFPSSFFDLWNYLWPEKTFRAPPARL